MQIRLYKTVRFLVSTLLIPVIFIANANAGGGYFQAGYGPIGVQMSGAVTAVAQDAFAGSSNPAKLIAAGNRLDLSLLFLNPHRKLKRTGATEPNSDYNFSTTSKNSLFMIPEFAYSKQINDEIAIGIMTYGNGGLNIEYHGTTGVAETNLNPDACGNKPGNFMGGCDELGFDIGQFIVAPTLAWKIAPGQSIGISPLLSLEMFKAYGLHAFSPVSRAPGSVTDRGRDYTFGAGLRVGWFGEFNEWLSLGAAYSTKIYMQDYDKYKGLFAEGSFDTPANYSVGIAIKPWDKWLVAFDILHIDFKGVKALSNGVLPSLVDPMNNPLGSKSGSGFGWDRNQTNYKFGVAYKATSRLTLRAGHTFSKSANDNDINAVSFGVLAINPVRTTSAGFSWQANADNKLHAALSYNDASTYGGPSALFPGARESVRPFYYVLSLSWSRSI